MEGEIKNFIAVWLTVLASLYYCHTIAKLIPKGIPTLLTIFPIIPLFLYLHLHLTTIHLGSITCFFVAWLANFKLLLFAFGRGPLSPPPPPNPPLSFPRFVLISCLPIKIDHHHPSPPPPNFEKPPPKKYHKSPVDYAIRVLLVAIFLQLYKYKQYLHPKIVMLVYCFHIYVTLEGLLALMATVAQALGRVELEPPFDEPYLSTSLQDFWGRRWNQVVVSILRPTVYDPVRCIASRLMGRKWASVPATMATFLVSGLMHELVFYNIGRAKPTWEVTCFFLIHGACLVVENWVKKSLNGKFRLPPAVSGPLVVSFVVGTGLWLFIPAFLRGDTDVRVRREIAAFVEFVKEIVGNFRVRSFKFDVVSV
ncbi:hypothetical protein U1Q18_008802 [Sarracenia purpurea var. burkii]